jgi:Protein of unknown function (DUF1236)
MNFATTFSLGMMIALAAVSDATASEPRWVQETRLAQVRPDNLRGIGLTDAHKQIIFDHLATEQPQTVPKDTELYVGSTMPDSIVLNAMPIATKDQIGVLKDYKFIKLANDKVLLLDPATRQIVDIITKQDAGR